MLAGAAHGHPLPINFTREWRALLTGDHLEGTLHLSWRDLSSCAKSGINAGMLELCYCSMAVKYYFCEGVLSLLKYMCTMSQDCLVPQFLLFQTKGEKNLLMRASAIKQSWVCMVEQTTAMGCKKESIQKGTDLLNRRETGE